MTEIDLKKLWCVEMNLTDLNRGNRPTFHLASLDRIVQIGRDCLKNKRVPESYVIVFVSEDREKASDYIKHMKMQYGE